MSDQTFAIDYSGARGSNTGDEFHELWATRQALRLLDTTTGLTAITVEGMTVAEGKDRVWDGVDCAAFYGGDTAVEADRVELQQMKYSAADVDRPWTVARLATGRDGKVAASPILRLAQSFQGLLKARPGRSVNSVRISLVTNQSVGQDLLDAIEAAKVDVPAAYAKPWRKGGPDLHRLVHASGLSTEDFKRFAEVLDLQTSSGSRFEIEDEMLKAIAAWSDTEFVESAAQLRGYIRKRMMPEAAGETITRARVLLQIGVSDGRSLFPCPSEIKAIHAPVKRGVARTVADRLIGRAQHLCIHGSGGAGKTTLLQEIEDFLPAGSVMLKFDCYGGGSYLDASALRHRPHDAFVQLANELAQRLRLPMLMPPRGTVDHPRLFRRRLELAANVLAQVHPEALLVIAIDAADNSVTAAHSRTPPERSFVHDLMSFEGLPVNTRILISARTGRLGDLALPSTFQEVSLPGFDKTETGFNVARYWNAAPSDWVEDFHHLSGGVPRVQAYAFEAAEGAPEHAIDALRPVGKRLDQIFRAQFQLALKKAGRPYEVQLLCAGLIALPRPIPVTELAAVLAEAPSQVVDVCSDLAPGVRLHDNQISFADEDFEAFVRDEAGAAVTEVLARAADRLSANATTSAYAALNVAPVLLAAGRGVALLDLVERAPEPPPTVMPDPVRRREVLVQRLQAAIKVCQDAGDTARALRFVLIGADAKGTDHATRKLMTQYPGLTARYAAETASRLVLGDPDAIPEHGPLLCQLVGEDARRGDGISAREDRRRLRAWLDARQEAYEASLNKFGHGHAWSISPDDIAATAYATFVLGGVDEALARYGGIRPNAFNASVLRIVVARLLAEDRSALVEALAAKMRPAWAVFVYVPLAMAGRPIDLARLTQGLASLKRRFDLGPDGLRFADFGDKTRQAVIDTVLSAAEILVAAGVRSATTDSVFASFQDPEARRLGRMHDFDVALLDAILRSCTLGDAIAGTKTSIDTVFTPRLPATSDDKRRDRSDYDRTDRGVKEVAGIVLSLYVLRAKTLSAGNPAPDFAEELAEAQRHFESERWRIQSRPSALEIRIKASECLTVLLAAGAHPPAVMATAVKLRSGWPTHFGDAQTLLFERLAAIPSLHPDLAQSLTQSAQATKDARIGAEEKAQNLATFAQFLTVISPVDAEVVFKDAVHAASELDQEIAHQLRLVGHLAERGLPAFGDQKRPLAQALAEVVHDAAVRLEHNECRWFDSFATLARLDLPVALSAAARWCDTDRAQLSDSLRPITTVGLDQNQLAVSDAAALFGLMAKPNSDHLLALVERAAQDGAETAAQLAEEWAHDLLVDRISDFKDLSDFIAKHGRGSWASRLAAQTDFEAALDKAAEAQAATPSIRQTQNPHRPCDILDTQVWAVDDLVEPQRLAHAVEDVTDRLRAAKQYPSDMAVFEAARKAVPFARRLDHIKALADMRDRADVAAPVLAALSEWSSQPAIKQWAVDNLPALIVEALPDFARWLPRGHERLGLAFGFADLSGNQIQKLLLQGIARHADDFTPALTFALVELIGAQLQPSEAADLAQWYVGRLGARIAPIHLEGPPDGEIPTSVPEALGRFLYAFLSDVDVRVRWRAAHSLRRLARLGRADVLAGAVEQADRLEDVAFRDPKAPFYNLAARLWLVVALDRIADETPLAAAPHGARLLSIALDSRVPHILIRAYAAEACNKLVSQGLLMLTDSEATALAAVNTSPLPRGTDRSFRQPTDRFATRAPGARFRFDQMDTLPYWFDPWLRVFEGASRNEFQKEAERWIVDVWGVQDEAPYGSKEPRPRRFDDRSYNLTSNRDGDEPIMELHRRYLEWHAMWCTAGTMLQTHRLAPIDEWGEDPFLYRLQGSKLTVPPIWLADLARPTPLEPRYWREDRAPGPEWLERVSDDEFLRELRATDYPGYVVVDAYAEAKWLTFEQTAKINSALVAPQTAHALVRALQSYDNPFDYYLCPEGHDLEIDDDEFSLKGWLQHREKGPGFDYADVYRNGIRRIETAPGTALTAALWLEERLTPQVTWWRPGAQQPALIYEEWGDREPEDERQRTFGGAVTSRGRRLLIREADLQAFLVTQGGDLIIEVEITRRDRPDGSSSFDDEGSQSASFDRLLLLRRDDRLQAAERDLGAWRTHRPGA